MYVCEECLSVFEKPHKERIGAVNFIECPICGGGCIAKTMLCTNCGQYIKGDYVRTAWSDYLCDECYEEMNIFEQT